MPVSDACEAYLLLKGVIDVKKEAERLQTKKEKLVGPLSKLKELMQAADYADKVPSEVRDANSEKLVQLEGELAKVIDAINGISLIDTKN